MKLGDYEFERICDIEPLREADGSVRQFMPQSRYRNARNLPLNRYGAGPFCKFRIPTGFRFSGVYVLAIDDEMRYVGECFDFSARFNAGYGNISPKNCFKGRAGDELPREQSRMYGSHGRGTHLAMVLSDSGSQKDGGGSAFRAQTGLESDLNHAAEIGCRTMAIGV